MSVVESSSQISQILMKQNEAKYVLTICFWNSLGFICNWGIFLWRNRHYVI